MPLKLEKHINVRRLKTTEDSNGFLFVDVEQDGKTYRQTVPLDVGKMKMDHVEVAITGSRFKRGDS
jgi:hypothetical protein